MQLSEAVKRIKSAGTENTRITPASSGKHNVEVKTPGGWVKVVSDVTRPMAEDIIRQATNKVILG